MPRLIEPPHEPVEFEPFVAGREVRTFSLPQWRQLMAGMAPKRPGTTMHADWFGAWDDDVMKMWNGNCIDKLLNCSGGDLGNGKQLRMYDGFLWDANPRLIDPPA